MLNFLIFMKFVLIALGFYYSLKERKYLKDIIKRGHGGFHDGSDGD